MLIVFEGPDGSGKSTLAEAVQKRLDATRIHHGPPVAGRAMEQWMAALEVAASGIPVVCDRLHWGDPVYAPIYRPEVGEQLGAEGVHKINKRINDLGGLMVFVTADVPVLAERFDGKYINPEDLATLWDAYWECAWDSIIAVPLLTIDTSEGFDEFDEWVDLIITTATNLAAS